MIGAGQRPILRSTARYRSPAGNSFSFRIPSDLPRRAASYRLVGGQDLGDPSLGLRTGMSRSGEKSAAIAPDALTPIIATVRNNRRMTVLLGNGNIADQGPSVQTVKLSPQPQAPLALGLSNTKPAAKSSSRQSITGPTR